jgi:hypothetical protein
MQLSAISDARLMPAWRLTVSARARCDITCSSTTPLHSHFAYHTDAEYAEIALEQPCHPQWSVSVHFYLTCSLYDTLHAVSRRSNIYNFSCAYPGRDRLLVLALDLRRRT